MWCVYSASCLMGWDKTLGAAGNCQLSNVNLKILSSFRRRFILSDYKLNKNGICQTGLYHYIRPVCFLGLQKFRSCWSKSISVADIFTQGGKGELVFYTVSNEGDITTRQHPCKQIPHIEKEQQVLDEILTKNTESERKLWEEDTSNKIKQFG